MRVKEYVEKEYPNLTSKEKNAKAEQIYHNMDLVVSDIMKAILEVEDKELIIENFVFDNKNDKCFLHILFVTRMITSKPIKIKGSWFEIWKINRTYKKKFDKVKRAKSNEKSNINTRDFVVYGLDKCFEKIENGDFGLGEIYDEFYAPNR